MHGMQHSDLAILFQVMKSIKGIAFMDVVCMYAGIRFVCMHACLCSAVLGAVHVGRHIASVCL